MRARTVWCASAATILALAVTQAPAVDVNDTRLVADPAVSAEHVAFVYAEDLQIVPLAGGTARRLTWHPENDVVQGFTPDGEVLFTSGRGASDRRHIRGGAVGVLGFPGLMDGGSVSAPNPATWTEDGLVVENVGVPPDVEVEHLPAEVATGRDPQLEKAMELVLEALEADPPRKPARPPYPIRARQPCGR